MIFEVFEQQFEALLEEKSRRYPNSSDYLRHAFLRSIASQIEAMLARLRTEIDKDDAYWQNHEQIVSDVLSVMEVKANELLRLEVSDLPHGVRDFKTIKEKLYDTTAYPSQEHLYYRNFEPALERLRFFSKHLKKLDKSDMQFCDLGFGPGVLTQFILEEKPAWTACGVDISPECVRYAEKLMKLKGVDNRVQLTTGDVRNLPYADNTFDLVLAMEVLEHIPDPLKGLLEAVRVLKSGGYAIISIPVQLPIPMHLYVPQNPREVLDLYERANLEVLDFSAKEFKIDTGSFIATFALSVKV
ncbi:MAG: methyltransferase domain-containing protein [Candidatus Poribacteria bacterium]|nr:methyltransferase domain-containing protein [Candidatus Poribacteria bacterium]